VERYVACFMPITERDRHERPLMATS